MRHAKLLSLKDADVISVNFDVESLVVKYSHEGCSNSEFIATGVDFYSVENESIFFHRNLDFKSDGNGIWSMDFGKMIDGSLLEKAIILILGDYCITCVSRDFTI